MLTIEYINPSRLKPHPRNPRVHPDSALERLVRSIQEFGWTNPVLVDEAGRILAGHARVKAAKTAGLKEVPVIRLPLSGPAADAYMVADNRLQDLTDWDMPALEQVFEDLKLADFDLELTGFSIGESGLFDGEVTGLDFGRQIKIEDDLSQIIIYCPNNILESVRGQVEDIKKKTPGIVIQVKDA